MECVVSGVCCACVLWVRGRGKGGGGGEERLVRARFHKCFTWPMFGVKCTGLASRGCKDCACALLDDVTLLLPLLLFFPQCFPRLQSLLTAKVPSAVVHGHPDHRLPNTLSIAFPGVLSSQLLQDVRSQVAASAGAACHRFAV